ncbi:MAG: CAP domain-containing protein [Myxococcota bacterium]|nr:CAP domain-containing protein [Myxococcota bacterium]
MRWVMSGLVLAMVGCTGELSGELDPPDAARRDVADASNVGGDAGDPADGGEALDAELGLDADILLDASTGDAGAPDAGAPDACVAGAEVCNGRDDDCDGTVDELPSMSCGGSMGVCVPGIVECTGGAFPECTPMVGPSAETCDGRDEDCDGTTDESIAPMTCGTNVGRCSTGTRVCSGGTFAACSGQVGPRAELCDGVDDDCDTRTDEGVAPMTCGTNVGRCSTGTRVCSGGTFAACSGQVGPRSERCDGIDDDCDTRTDEGVAPMTCGTNVGTCSTGTRRCSGGTFGACAGSVGPRSELDDGLDNDCDGTVDEGIPCESAIEGEQRRLTNLERTSRGLRALACDRGLRRAARKHAADMCARDYFSHTSADGRTLVERVNAEGVVWARLGENIAHGYSTAAAVTAGWMGSPPHRANILDGRFGRVGVGYVACSGRHYWVQDFAD